jgi:hypothetical protein
MNLPKKDKHGKNRVSYSQIKTFRESKKNFVDRYILNKPFKGNAYTYFGSAIGSALENNNFGYFTESEKMVLLTARRLDLFERAIFLDFPGFYLMGYIDTISNDFSEIIDYKTGGEGKDVKYTAKEYDQIQLYALGIRQETGITPKYGSVEFITRVGNPYKGEVLRVGDAPIKKISIDLSEKRLTEVYYNTIRIVKEIDYFYSEYLKKSK